MSEVVEYGWRRIAVAGAAMLAALLQLADTTIVNVSLPTIDGSLGASADEGTWFITAYIVAAVVVIPLAPWLQTRLGRRRYFVIAVAGFTAMSLLCGFATDVGTEIVFRLLQGLFGGGIMLLSQQIMRDTFPAAQLALSQSLFALAIVVGPTIGPTLGGVLTDNLSWRWVFFINVLPGLLAAALAWTYLRDAEAPKPVRADGPGIVLLAAGLASMVYVLEQGERAGWFDDSTIVTLILVALASLGAFVWWELRGTATPAVALRVFRERAVWATSAINFLQALSVFGLFVVQPLFTQSVLAFTTTLGGEFMMVRAATMVVMFPATQWLVSRPRLDLRAIAALGIVVFAIATWWQSAQMTAIADFGTFVSTQILGGVGMSLIYVPLNVTLLRTVSPSIMPAAIALTRLAQQIGASAGAAVIIAYADRASANHAAALQAAVTWSRPAIHNFVAVHGPLSLGALGQIVQRQATVLGLADASRLLAVATLLCVPLVFLLKKPAPAPTGPRLVALPGYRPLPMAGGGSRERAKVA
ncbi:MAG TPA: DHA2 family efflux MFS transporter permease subunit [Candidatus Baltobacteraceae bacterium]|jgi:DHA2 family multidrug resistance protein